MTNVLTDPVTPPGVASESRYAGDPPGQLSCCPGCGIVLDHFLHKSFREPPGSWTPLDAAEDSGAPQLPTPPDELYVPKARTAGKTEPGPSSGFRPTHLDPTTVIISCRETEPIRIGRLIQSVLSSVPAKSSDVRVIAPRECKLPERDDLVAYRTDSTAEGLRLALNDADRPIRSEWLIWISDSANIKDHRWLAKLDETIGKQQDDARVGLVGVKRRTVLSGPGSEKAASWFRGAKWHQGRDFRNRLGQPAPNGNEIHYVLGHFWAARVIAIQQCGVPDARLSNAGIHVCIGEQMYQGGWHTKMFDGDHRLVGVVPPPPGKGLPKPPWYGDDHGPRNHSDEV